MTVHASLTFISYSLCARHPAKQSHIYYLMHNPFTDEESNLVVHISEKARLFPGLRLRALCFPASFYSSFEELCK